MKSTLTLDLHSPVTSPEKTQQGAHLHLPFNSMIVVQYDGWIPYHKASFQDAPVPPLPCSLPKTLQAEHLLLHAAKTIVRTANAEFLDVLCSEEVRHITLDAFWWLWLHHFALEDHEARLAHFRSQSEQENLLIEAMFASAQPSRPKGWKNALGPQVPRIHPDLPKHLSRKSVRAAILSARPVPTTLQAFPGDGPPKTSRVYRAEESVVHSHSPKPLELLQHQIEGVDGLEPLHPGCTECATSLRNFQWFTFDKRRTTFLPAAGKPLPPVADHTVSGTGSTSRAVTYHENFDNGGGVYPGEITIKGIYHVLRHADPTALSLTTSTNSVARSRNGSVCEIPVNASSILESRLCTSHSATLSVRDMTLSQSLTPSPHDISLIPCVSEESLHSALRAIRLEQLRIFEHMSKAYVRLFQSYTRNARDRWFTVLPEVLSVALFHMMVKSMPYMPKDMVMSSSFRREIQSRVTFWMTGVECPARPVESSHVELYATKRSGQTSLSDPSTPDEGTRLPQVWRGGRNQSRPSQPAHVSFPVTVASKSSASKQGARRIGPPLLPASSSTLLAHRPVMANSSGAPAAAPPHCSVDTSHTAWNVPVPVSGSAPFPHIDGPPSTMLPPLPQQQGSPRDAPRATTRIINGESSVPVTASAFSSGCPTNAGALGPPATRPLGRIHGSPVHHPNNTQFTSLLSPQDEISQRILDEMKTVLYRVALPGQSPAHVAPHSHAGRSHKYSSHSNNESLRNAVCSPTTLERDNLGYSDFNTASQQPFDVKRRDGGRKRLEQELRVGKHHTCWFEEGRTSNMDSNREARTYFTLTFCSPLLKCFLRTRMTGNFIVQHRDILWCV